VEGEDGFSVIRPKNLGSGNLPEIPVKSFNLQRSYVEITWRRKPFSGTLSNGKAFGIALKTSQSRMGSSFERLKNIFAEPQFQHFVNPVR
jgi:hypothetical protein